MTGSFAKREALLDEVSQDFLTRLVHLGGYCTALQAEGIGVRESGKRVRARLRMLQRLGFLRRVTKYPIVYQVTKSATRLHGPDSSSRRRTTPTRHSAKATAIHSAVPALASSLAARSGSAGCNGGQAPHLHLSATAANQPYNPKTCTR